MFSDYIDSYDSDYDSPSTPSSAKKRKVTILSPLSDSKEDISEISEYENVMDENVLTDLDLSRFNLDDSNMRIKSFIALHNYLLDLKTRNLLCSMDSQWVIRKESFGEGETQDVEAFKVYSNNPELEAIGTKLLSDTQKNRSEIQYYNYFTDVVLYNINPHFPLISVSQECNLCNSIGIKLKKLNKCLLVFSELADGSASKYFPVGRDSFHLVDELLSMTCQVLMALITLKSAGVVHGDLNFGNILYHEEQEEIQNKGKYLHYIYNNKHIYVKHEGKLWVLWDFGRTTPEGEYDNSDDRVNINTFYIDMPDFLDRVNKRISTKNLSKNIIMDMSDYILRDNNIKNNTISEDGIINLLEKFPANFPNHHMIISDSERDDLQLIYPTYNL